MPIAGHYCNPNVMKLFSEVPPQENIIDLHIHHAETLEGIADCQRIITYLEGLRYLSEVETAHLRTAKESLYKFNCFKEEINSHLKKFLN